jgi:hypothetical protein
VKIAFAFNTINGLHPLWHDYFRGAKDTCILLHHREPLINIPPLPDLHTYFRLVDNGYVKALQLHLSFLEMARTYNCDKLINLSESCIPTRPYHELRTFLQQHPGKTIMNYFPFPETKNEVGHLIPKADIIRDNIHKNHPWIILDKSHFYRYLSEYYKDLFLKVDAGTETYWSTIAVIRGIEPEIINYQTTFTDWSRPHIRSGACGPHLFDSYNREDYSLLKGIIDNKQYFFARKFAPLAPEYLQLIQTIL